MSEKGHLRALGYIDKPRNIPLQMSDLISLFSNMNFRPSSSSSASAFAYCFLVGCFLLFVPPLVLAQSLFLCGAMWM